MIKKLRLILPMFVVLLSGYIQHSGRGYNEPFFVSAVKHLEVSVFSGCIDFSCNQDFLVQSLPLGSENGNIKNHAPAIEEKDEELVAFRRYPEFSNEIFTDFYTHTSTGFRHFVSNQLFSAKNFCYFPSYKSLYLLLKVFRI